MSGPCSHRCATCMANISMLGPTWAGLCANHPGMFHSLAVRACQVLAVVCLHDQRLAPIVGQCPAQHLNIPRSWCLEPGDPHAIVIRIDLYLSSQKWLLRTFGEPG
jgi:hypothetical protein